MALYVSIDEDYLVVKLNGLKAIISESKGYTLENGETVNESVAKKELKSSGAIRLYDYDEDELEEINNGVPVRKDWTLKIQKL